MLSNENLTQSMRELRDAVEIKLDALIPPPEQRPADLHRSMRHTLLAPGKRVRALLTLFAAMHLGGDEEKALSSACALEMVHAASLILDDLPAMDNASLRRGRPANHGVYGEATAILAAIGLLNRAFGIIAEDETLDAGAKVRLAEILSRSVGSEGLVAGQEQDLKWAPAEATREDVALVHARKTAALFSAAGEMGAVAAGADEAHVGLLRDFGLKLGLAFQILDDLIDATDNRESAGKDVSQDHGRPSLVLTIGLDAARREAQNYIEDASSLISCSGGDETALRHFAMGLIAGLENKLKSVRGLG
ncbi:MULTISPECIES: polyprenyl synthetase family protein [Rhodomicrobium]|uniref:polyprenyl synthetase family protein n=1 Tax=Rhodomicrobium TaxID=1068 RepID=UPI000B4B9C02|nr:MULTISPECIES: polyprenyl synthetase family protein [Rhodomicrobium]